MAQVAIAVVSGKSIPTEKLTVPANSRSTSKKLSDKARPKSNVTQTQQMEHTLNSALYAAQRSLN
jgi:hypothetical protein